MTKYGSRRVVILRGDVAVKSPRGPEGLAHNLREWELWQRTNDPRLCPALWCEPDGSLLVMVRASQPVPQVPLPPVADLCDDWQGRHQWGFLNGRAVLLDYAGGGWA